MRTKVRENAFLFYCMDILSAIFVGLGGSFIALRMPLQSVVCVGMCILIYFFKRDTMVPAHEFYKNQNYWRNMVEGISKQYTDTVKRNDDLNKQIPNFEFIFGNKETGWCWFEQFDERYENLSIGTTIRLWYNDTHTRFTVSKFNRVYNNSTEYPPTISFQVVEANPAYI